MTTFTGEVHPLAAKFPMLCEEDLDELAEDIATVGLNHPIVIDERGTLLDGRNRLAACRLAGVEPQFETFTGPSPVAFIISENLRRRDLTPSQRAMLAVDLLPHFEAEAAEARRAAGGDRRSDEARSVGATSPQAVETERAPKSTERAGAAVGVSGRTVARAKAVAEQAPDLAEKVRSGELSVSDAEKQAKQRKAAEEEQARARTVAAGRAVTAEQVLSEFPFVGGPSGVCTTKERLEIAQAVANAFNARPDGPALADIARDASKTWRNHAADVAKRYAAAVTHSRTRSGLAEALLADGRHLIEPLKEALYDVIDDAEAILRTLEKTDA